VSRTSDPGLEPGERRSGTQGQHDQPIPPACVTRPEADAAQVTANQAAAPASGRSSKLRLERVLEIDASGEGITWQRGGLRLPFGFDRPTRSVLDKARDRILIAHAREQQRGTGVAAHIDQDIDPSPRHEPDPALMREEGIHALAVDCRHPWDETCELERKAALDRRIDQPQAHPLPRAHRNIG
jgi:hypothetical protein